MRNDFCQFRGRAYRNFLRIVADRPRKGHGFRADRQNARELFPVPLRCALFPPLPQGFGKDFRQVALLKNAAFPSACGVLPGFKHPCGRAVQPAPHGVSPDVGGVPCFHSSHAGQQGRQSQNRLLFRRKQGAGRNDTVPLACHGVPVCNGQHIGQKFIARHLREHRRHLPRVPDQRFSAAENAVGLQLFHRAGQHIGGCQRIRAGKQRIGQQNRTGRAETGQVQEQIGSFGNPHADGNHLRTRFRQGNLICRCIKRVQLAVKSLPHADRNPHVSPPP